MKIELLAMLFMAALAVSACSDDDKNEGITVPDTVAKALKDKYPAAANIEWEQKGKYYVAECRMDGKGMDVWFGTDAV